MKLNLVKKTVLALALASSALAFAETAKVISVTGKVEVNRKDAWVPLAKDAVLNEGEVISTGFKSEALIQYKESVMKLGALTRITLEQLAASDTKDDVSVYLNTGTIRSTVNHAENRRINYTVRNPIAVASVRGTIVGMDGTGATDCGDGGVDVLPADAVDPVKHLGIKKPADRKVSADGAEASGEAGKTLAPAGGTTNSFTNTSDINPNLPGGTLLTKGQSMNIGDNDGLFTGNAQNNTQININAVGTIGSTASENEFKQIGSAGDGVELPGSSSKAPNSGSLVVNVKFAKD